jgi:hypothetical protein
MGHSAKRRTPRCGGSRWIDVFVTTDRNIRYQQNLTSRKIAIVVLGKGRWRLIKNRLQEIATAIATAIPGSLVEVEIAVE